MAWNYKTITKYEDKGGDGKITLSQKFINDLKLISG